MAEAPPTIEEMQKVFAEYVASRRIVIADPSSGSRASILRILRDLGAKAPNVALVSRYDDAVAEIGRLRPNIVICDYTLDGKCGLRLVQPLRRLFPNPRDTLFVLVTSNGRESSIAEAAEEDVDGYILKPFSVEIFKENFLRAAWNKIQPSQYALQIQEGKAKLATGKLDEAEIFFESAILLIEKPVLAYYYHGQACVMGKRYPPAERSYLSGLQLNDLHYRCMRGLLELHMIRGENDKAYALARKLVEYYPISPQLLDQVLRLAVQTGGFEDIDDYFLVFTQLDDRSPELVKCMIAALVVAGKYHLDRRHMIRAAELFKRAVIVSSRGAVVLREVILALLAARQPGLAGQFLNEFPAETHASPEFLSLDLAIISATGTASQAIDYGRKLVSSGTKTPDIYEILIRRSAQAGLEESAENYAREAIQIWPQLKARFEAFLKK